jgi:ribonuclease P protein component
VAPGERQPRRRGRLSRSGDFERAYREGRSHANRYLILYAFPRPADEAEGARLGVSVGRKVGGAVQRNAIKRALRDAFWELSERLPASHDFVVVARADLPGLVEREGSDAIPGCLEELLREGRLLEERKT